MILRHRKLLLLFRYANMIKSDHMQTLIQVVSRRGTINVRRSHYRTARVRGHAPAFMQDVDRGVPIAIQSEPTLRTDKSSFTQAQLSPLDAATGTGFRGREETVYLDK